MTVIIVITVIRSMILKAIERLALGRSTSLIRPCFGYAKRNYVRKILLKFCSKHFCKKEAGQKL